MFWLAEWRKSVLTGGEFTPFPLKMYTELITIFYTENCDNNEFQKIFILGQI